MNDSVICERRSYEKDPLTHFHPFAQLIIPIRGLLYVSIDHSEMINDQPTVIYIPPQFLHSFYAPASNQFLVFDIPVAYIPPDNSMMLPESQIFDDRWEAISLLLSKEVGENPASSGKILDLFRYILQLFDRKIGAPSLNFIHNHYYRHITIEELAAIEHYNPNYYCEWFQKQHGLSPMAYIRHLRLDMAKKLLKETNYSIVQVAQQIGYRNHSTLTKLFREYVGMLPSEFRIKSRMLTKHDPYSS